MKWRKDVIIRVIKWILLILWMTVIFSFSAQNGVKSQELSDGLLNKVLVNIPFIKYFYFNGIGVLIRKLAHFCEYLVLGILSYFCFKDINKSRFYVIAIIFCVLYAVSDEFHQLFIDGRSFGYLDILIDSLGSASGVLISRFVEKRCGKLV